MSSRPPSGGGPPSCDGFCKDPSATMSILGICAGVVLAVGGIFGIVDLNILRAMTSVYSLAFGLIIVLSECKHVPLLSVLYRQLEYYAHFLVYPRGKALFYVFVGILTFFSWPAWNFSKIADLIVVCVGVLHFVASFCYKQEEPPPGTHFSPGMGPANQPPPDFRADATREAIQFAQDHPETARKGASALVSASAKR